MSDQGPNSSTEIDVNDGASGAALPAAPRPRLPVAIIPRTLWSAAGVVLIGLVLVVLVTKALNAVVLVFLSIILGEAIRPLVARLQRRHIPQPLAVILIYLAVIVVLGGLLWVMINPIVTEASSLNTHGPEYLARLQHWLAGVNDSLSKNPANTTLVHKVSATLANWAQQTLPALLSVPIAVLAGLFGLVINAVIALTMTLFWLGCSTRFKNFIVELFPADKRQMVSGIATQMSRSLGGWVRGMLIAMVLIGSLTAIGLLIVGVPYALLLGILAGLTEVIPYLGPWISGSVSVVVTLVATGNPLMVLWAIVVFIIIQEVEGNVVEPLVMQKAVKLEPWIVLVAILVGGQLLGLIGLILAVPVAALLQVVTLEVVAPMIRLVTNPKGSTAPSVT